MRQDATNCERAPGGGDIYLRVMEDANHHQRTLLLAWCAGYEDEGNWRLCNDFLHRSVPQLWNFAHTVVGDQDKARSLHVCRLTLSCRTAAAAAAVLFTARGTRG